MRIRITVEDDTVGGRAEWAISREFDPGPAHDDTIVGNLITPMMDAFDDAAWQARIPEAEWREE
jgi:hypothetical protein